MVAKGTSLRFVTCEDSKRWLINTSASFDLIKATTSDNDIIAVTIMAYATVYHR